MDRTESYLKEISAEMLVNYLYPDKADKWSAEFSGRFYRNYSSDAIEVDPDTEQIRLSRDGLLNRIPQGFISGENDLRGRSFTAEYEKLKKRRRTLDALFAPFDTFEFRRKLKLESAVSELIDHKYETVLRGLFPSAVQAGDDKYVREAMVFLPLVSAFRSNLSLLRRMLALLTGLEVKMETGIYSPDDTTRNFVPKIAFFLLEDGLDTEAYLRRMEEIAPLTDFIREWFIPVEAEFSIGLRGTSDDAVGDMMLDYNAEII